MAKNDKKPLSFQGLILTLQNYWAEQGCVILQPFDTEVGAGTLHPATVLRSLGPKPWNVAYVQPSPKPLATLLSVPSHYEAQSGQLSGFISRQS